MNFNSILQQITDWSLSSGIRLLVIVILTLVALRVAKLLSNRMFSVFIKDAVDSEMEKRAKTLGSLVKYVLSVTILVVSLVMILGEFGIAIGPIMAAAGVVGLALGFGSQHLVQDIISGFFILIDDEVRVGDVVQTAGKSGIVEQVNLRMVVLRDLSGNVHYIRNGQIDIVSNMTKDFSCYVFDIGVAYREDVDEVISVIKEVGAEIQNDSNFGPDILEPIEVLGLDQFGDSALVIKARFKTRPIKQWRVAREFNRRLKIAFDQRNIEIPFPHRTVYMGQDKQGQAPPINIVLPEKAGHAA